MTDARTIVFFPEGAYGPTNNCVGDRRRPARARPPGRVHRRGVVRRHARGEGLRGAADAPRAARRPSRRCPASSGSTSSATPRRSSASRPSSSSSEFIAPTFQALIDGAKYVHPRLVEIFDELAPRRHRRGQRRRPSRRSPATRPAVGPDRVVQSGRDQGPARRAVLVGLPRRRSDRLAGASSRRSAGRTATCGPTSMRSVASTAMTASSTTSSGPPSSPSRRG